MQAVILAAGKGSRLHPITTTRSKAMLPVLGKPIVERVMEHLVVNGLDDFILVVSPDDRQTIHYFQHESKLGAGIRFVYQPQRLGMANALHCAAPYVRGDFFLSACDNLTSPEHIAHMLACWQSDPSPNAVLTLMPVEPERLGSAGIVDLDGDRVTCIVEKPAPGEAPSNIASLPLYCFSQKILAYLPQVPLSPRGEYELQDAIQMLIERDGRVRGVLVDRRLTLTSPGDLLRINRHYLEASSGHSHLRLQSIGDGTDLVPPLYIESGVIIGSNCTIGPNVYIEHDCRIGQNATIRNAVLLREAIIPDGSIIEDQVVW